MAVVALANPLIYHGGGVYSWTVTLFGALLAAAAVYGLYALFFTQRARAAGIVPAVALTWAMLLVIIASEWMGGRAPANEPTRAAPASVMHDTPQSKPVDWSQFTPIEDEPGKINDSR
jgi:hypothetical protein